MAYPLVYLGWAYAFWTPALLSERSVWAMPNLVFFLIGGASPLLAGVLLGALDGGRPRIRDIFHRLVDVRRIPGRWWLGVFGFWLLFDLTMAGAGILLGVSESPLNPNWDLLADPASLLFLLLLSFVFPAVEEVGLRGYYLDALHRSVDRGPAAVINGVVWAIWHAPFVFFTGYYANTTFHPELYWWMPMIVCHTVLIAFVYDRTRRSVLAVLLFHAMMNFTGEWLRISPDMYPFMLGGTVVVTLPAFGLLLRRGRPGAERSSPLDEAGGAP